MKEEKLYIDNIPAVIYGEAAKKVYLFVHGKCGNKEEGKAFAEFAVKNGYQVFAFDLPEHGERKSEQNSFLPWKVVPEIKAIVKYLKSRYESIALRANSIGAYFSMLALCDEKIEKSLFVSPIVDMKRLILSMMQSANITEEKLKAEGEIVTDYGETLSYKYLEYARHNSFLDWSCHTAILYGEEDNLTDYETIKEFCSHTDSSLVVMPNGEHWFHTDEEVTFLNWWTEREV